jgi:hypothetical protein
MNPDPTNPPGIIKPADQLAALAREINDEHHKYERAVGECLAHARRVGQLLIDAKARCKHGEWEAWVQANLTFGDRQARKYMRIARSWDRGQIGTGSSDLSINAALKLLAADEPAPPTPRPAVSVPSQPATPTAWADDADDDDEDGTAEASTGEWSDEELEEQVQADADCHGAEAWHETLGRVLKALEAIHYHVTDPDGPGDGCGDLTRDRIDKAISQLIQIREVAFGVTEKPAK